MIILILTMKKKPLFDVVDAPTQELPETGKCCLSATPESIAHKNGTAEELSRLRGIGVLGRVPEAKPTRRLRQRGMPSAIASVQAMTGNEITGPATPMGLRFIVSKLPCDERVSA
jgi:hypothetical protein